MIISTEVKIKMNGKHIEKYKSIGYDVKVGDLVSVKIDDIPKGSHVLISAMCCNCSFIKEVKYYTYIKCTNDNSYYYCSNCSYNKVKINNMNKYGVENTLELESVKNDRLVTLKSKYGVDNISKISQNKVKITKYIRYGDERYNNRELAKKTILDRYGVDNALQNISIFHKQQLSGFISKKYGDLYYRGSYELDFIKYCEYNKIRVENGPSIKYRFNNSNKIYHSDFYLPEYNLICEIKSKYYYDIYYDKNICKSKKCIEDNYNFIFIIDKDYTSLLDIIKKTSK